MERIFFWEFLILAVAITLSQNSPCSRIDFYEHADFRGRILRVDVDSHCQRLPQNCLRQISSLQSWGCGKFYMDTKCQEESIRFNNEDVKDLGELWTKPKRYHRYWRNKHWNDKIMSYGSCEIRNDKDQLKEIATRYLEEVNKRTIPVNELRKIGKDQADHMYDPNQEHHVQRDVHLFLSEI